MKLTFCDRFGSLRFRRYQHKRHGVIETLTQQSVVYVRPVFGLLKPDEQQEPEVAEFRTQKPKKTTPARRLGGMWKRGGARSAGGNRGA